MPAQGFIIDKSINEFGNLFAPDTLLPAQWVENFRRSEPDSEHRLIHAVLETAINDYSQRQGKLYWAARDWLTDLSDEALMSIRWVCDALGIDVGTLVKRIEQNATIPRIRRPPTSHRSIVVEKRERKRPTRASSGS